MFGHFLVFTSSEHPKLNITRRTKTGSSLMWPRRAGKQTGDPTFTWVMARFQLDLDFWIWIMESCLLYNYTAVPLARTVWSWTSFLRVLWCSVSCYLARLLPERNKRTVHKRYIILSVLSFHWRPLDSKTSTMRTICGVRVSASVILAGKRDSRRHGPFLKYLTTLLCPSKNFQSAMFSVSLGACKRLKRNLKQCLRGLS